MPLTFYPNQDDVQRGTLRDRIETLMSAAEQYRALILDPNNAAAMKEEKKGITPRDQNAAYNWEEISRVLREIRELPEGNKTDKIQKAELLKKLAEIYEVLRAAKMSKLEAVRLALISEANQLQTS
jgi:hypothetical protein